MAGAAVLAAVWLGPLAEVAGRSFTGHMSAHMAVVAAAAPLLAFALTVRETFVTHARRWLSPVPASLAELVVVWVWHTPRLHHAARVDGALFVAEQASFLGAGLAFWLAVWTATLADRGRSAGAAMLGLLLTLAHMTLLGALIALSPRPIFATAHGLDALADQQRGGVVMLVISAVVYLGAGVAVGHRLLRPRLAPAGGLP